MATLYAPPARVTIDGVFGRAFGALRADPVTLFGLSLILQAVPGILINAAERTLGYGSPMRQFATPGGWVMVAIVGLLALFLYLLVQAAQVRAMVAIADGRRARFGEAIGGGLSRTLPLLGLSILLVLACYAGMILLLVPGIMLYLMWSVAGPALVAERIGVFEAFGRSRALTKGHRWRIFAVELIVILAVSIVSALLWVPLRLLAGTPTTLAAVQDMQQHGPPLTWQFAQVLVSTVTTTIWCAVQNALYLELVEVKDGAGPTRLADVFA